MITERFTYLFLIHLSDGPSFAVWCKTCIFLNSLACHIIKHFYWRFKYCKCLTQMLSFNNVGQLPQTSLYYIFIFFLIYALLKPTKAMCLHNPIQLNFSYKYLEKKRILTPNLLILLNIKCNDHNAFLL